MNNINKFLCILAIGCVIVLVTQSAPTPKISNIQSTGGGITSGGDGTLNTGTITNLTIISNVVVNQNITVKGGGTFNSITVTNSLVYVTNLTALATPDFAKGYTLFTTNAAFTLSAPVGIDPGLAQTTCFIVTNSTAAVKVITPPANVITSGTFNVTNLTVITFFQFGSKFTNAISLPIN